jgi:hypothetical protein
MVKARHFRNADHCPRARRTEGRSATLTNPDTAVAYIRLPEWSSVLLAECAKGRRGRRYWMPRAVLTGVLAYCEATTQRPPVRRGADLTALLTSARER